MIRETLDSFALGSILLSLMSKRTFFTYGSKLTDGEALLQLACIFGCPALFNMAARLGMSHFEVQFKYVIPMRLSQKYAHGLCILYILQGDDWSSPQSLRDAQRFPKPI